MWWFDLSPLFLTPEVTRMTYFFSNFWLILDLLNCWLYEMRPLILIRKPKLWRVIMLKYSILSTGSYLRPIRRRNVDIFIIYYRTRNQKDKLLFIEKNMSFSSSAKTESQNKCIIKFRYNLYLIHTWISMYHFKVHHLQL